ncbi:MAG TPA: hypothetical protein VLJ37_06505 [bacterium]|nr:hypothetical protein [bacterium]
MATTVLIPGFLNQALIYGFRIGGTQIAGSAGIEAMLSDGQTMAVDDPSAVREALSRLDAGMTPLSTGIFAHPKPQPRATHSSSSSQVRRALPPSPDDAGAPIQEAISKATSARDRIAEGFTALIEILAERMESDIEAATLAFHTGRIPRAIHDPSEYDPVSIAFVDAADQARRETAASALATDTALFLDQLQGFPDAIHAENLMDIIAWSLRTRLYLPAEWELPAVILQLLTAQIEWKMSHFGAASDSLKDLADQMARLQGPQHEWELEAHLHYLAGTALFVMSFMEINDRFEDASIQFRKALRCFEHRNEVDPALRERFALGFFSMAEVLASRGRMEEAAVQYNLAASEMANASQRASAEDIRLYAEQVVSGACPVQSMFASPSAGSGPPSGMKN